MMRKQWQWIGGSHDTDQIGFEHPGDHRRRLSSKAIMPAVRQSANWVDHRNRNYIFAGCSDGCKLLHSWLWMK